jgi:hypothetical protein
MRIIMHVYLAIFFLTASVYAQDTVMRQHIAVSHDGPPSYMTELVVNGTRESLYTLFETPAGERLIFFYGTDDAARTTTISVTDPRSGEFVRGTFTLQYGGSSPDESKAARWALPPAAYDVPFSVMTKTFHGVGRQGFWHGAEGTETRTSLRQHLSPAFLQRVLRYSQDLSNAGSPAPHMACDFLVSLLTDKTSCRRDRSIVVQPLENDCPFDAKFGFPCNPPAK